jgi:hypothetical protein
MISILNIHIDTLQQTSSITFGGDMAKLAREVARIGIENEEFALALNLAVIGMKTERKAIEMRDEMIGMIKNT